MEQDIKKIIGSLVAVGFVGDEYNRHIKKMIRVHKVSNVILFARNVSSLAKLTKLTQKIHEEIIKYTGLTPLIMIDQEGGVVTRIFEEAVFLPGAMTIAASQKDSRRIGKILGSELLKLGINMNLAPILDVNTNPMNPVIGVRSFSDDKEMVSKLASEEIIGMQSEGIIATAKHFPGHGDTHVDSHLGLPVVLKTKNELTSNEIYSFKKAIDAGVKAVMSAHILFPEIDSVPATLSKSFLTDILRGELGFNGLVISDCMQMKAIQKEYTTPKGVLMGLKAGLDIALISHSEELQTESIKLLEKHFLENKDLFIEKAKHIEKLKKETRPFLKPFYEKTTSFNNETDKAFSQEVVDDSLTLILGKPFLKGKKTLALVPSIKVQTIAEDKFKDADLFTLIRNSHLNITPLRISLDAIDEIVLTNHLKNYDNVIFFSYNAYLNKKQKQFISLVNYYHKEVYVISLRGPYDLLELKNVNNFMCLYEYTPNAINTIMKFLQGEVVPKGVLPVKVKRTFVAGASIYVGLSEYKHKDNLKYLELLKSANIDEVFISGHMPEANSDFLLELTEIIDRCNELGIKVVLDMSKPSFSKIKDYSKIYALRLDWGFSREDVIHLSKNYDFLIELNASCVRESDLMFYLKSGISHDRIRLSHNFYPKKYTGLSLEKIDKLNQMFHRHGFAVMAYITCGDKRRPPLKEGLVTIEEHRNQNIYSQLLDMKYLQMDSVYFGDSYATGDELSILKNYSIFETVVPYKRMTDYVFSEKQRLRSDQGEYLIRLGKREKNVKPVNTIKRDRKSLTVDNEKFLRYSGEMAICLKDLEADERVNVIGKVLCSDFSLKALQNETEITLKEVKDE